MGMEFNTKWLEFLPFHQYLFMWLLAASYLTVKTYRACRRDQIELRAKRQEIGLCPECGYDLRATPNRCPECGQAPVQLPSPKRHAK